MNAKERFYSGLAKETIGKITSNTDNWTSFLRTMSRNYEFTYPEQVMIYAQRPNATFCKPYEDWNAENYRRYVKRGSTGIALFVMNRDKPYLRYVFDVADTGVRRSSPELKPWEVTPENRSYVMEAMERTFGVAADGVLEAQLEDIASALAAEYWDDYKKQFLDIVANSFLEEYDELNIEVAFKNAVANSVCPCFACRSRPQGCRSCHRTECGRCHRDLCPRWSIGKYAAPRQPLPRRSANGICSPGLSCSHRWRSWW